MMQAFILIGASGSGKSTAANELVQRFYTTEPAARTAIFSLDTCRLQFHAKNAKQVTAQSYDKAYAFASLPENQTAFWQFVDETWIGVLSQYDNIIVDNDNATEKDRERWLSDLIKHGYEVTMVVFSTPVKVAIERQTTRSDKCVPEEAVLRRHSRIELPPISNRYRIKELDGTKPMPELFHIFRRSAIIKNY